VRYPPDWIPEDPDGHRWVTPASPDCPDCDCCTAVLCERAKGERMACRWFVGNKGPGTADVSGCPCSADPTIDELRALYTARAAAGDREAQRLLDARAAWEREQGGKP
jgi:hypothetical protein